VERYNSIKEFVLQLDRKEKSALSEKEDTIIIHESNPFKQAESVLAIDGSKKTFKYSVAIICTIALIVGMYFYVCPVNKSKLQKETVSDTFNLDFRKARNSGILMT
jgi:hypothetical protein